MNECKTDRWMPALVVIAISLSSIEAGAVELMYAVSAVSPPRSNTFFTVDIATGDSTQIGPEGMGLDLNNTVALAARPGDGRLFMQANSGTFGELYTVDKSTGLATLIAAQDPVNEIAFDLNGRLYTTLASGAVNATGPIGVFDFDSGEVTSLGGDDLPKLAGLAFNPQDGHLYGITLTTDADDYLLKISADGQLVDSIQLGLGVGTAGAIVFAGNGQLVGSDLSGQLFDIDISTGAVGNFRHIFPGLSAQGLAREIPEPSALMLVGIALASFSASIRYTTNIELVQR